MAKPYPRYYVVNDSLVKIVQLPGGADDALLFDFGTGGFFPDPSYLSRVSEAGIGTNVHQLSEVQFDTLVADFRQSISEKLLAMPIVWKHTGDAEFAYQALVEGRTFTIRINDFPDEPLYSLLVEDQELEDLEDWPPAWVEPDIPQSLLDMLEETRKPK